MENRALLLFFVCLFMACNSIGRKSKESPTLLFNLDYDDMLSIKGELKTDTSQLRQAYAQLIVKADSILQQAPQQVTDGDIPPTGDVHDFFAIGKYAFSNPDTADGLPYIRKDGITNPDARGDRYDLARWEQTTENINTLALAWFYSENEQYAGKASELLKVWFINKETRMNPNFECAAALPGVYNGMPIGIIFGARLVDFLDHVLLLSLSESWTNTDNKALKKWFAEYTDWLLHSDFGIKESQAGDNHGTWYSAQVAASAIYTGSIPLAKQMIDKGKEQMSKQIAINREGYPDGSLPREINRNQSFLYSIFGLEGFCALAGCGNAIGYDLWHYETENGQGLRMAFKFLTPYLLEQVSWPYESLKSPQEQMYRPVNIVRQAAKMFQTDDLIELQEHLQQYVTDRPVLWLESKDYTK